MGFLAPAFIAGLATLAVPVIIHLINRERRTVVEFPSLMFLHKIPYRSVRRQKLRHLLLLALRCLALAILVFAFARPFFQRKTPATSSLVGAKERIILLDHSYSMGYGDHWKKAQDAARAATRDIGGTDRATLVVFANDAVAQTEPTADHARLERGISGATVSSEGTRFGPAVKLASQILAGSNLPRKEVVIISDFQKIGWARRDEMRVPPGTVVTPVDVSQRDEPDMAVTQVTTDRDRGNGRDRVTVAARLTNVGSAPRTVDATLALGGRDVETKHVTAPPSGAVQVSFSPMGVPTAATRGTVRITHDSLPQNDVFHFTLAQGEAVSVLLVEPARPRANASLFVSRALAIGDKPAFRIDVKSIDSLRPTDFADRSLVVLNEVDPPAGATGARLREMIAAGSGLLVVPGDVRAQPLSPEWQALMPARLGPSVDRTRDAGGTLAVDYGHPVFEIFSAPRSGDFSTAHFFRYRTLTAPGDSTGKIIARFDDGSPALVERTAGHGKVLVWASSLDEYWTDLPLQPVFLPFIHQVAKYAGRYSDARLWFTAGDVLDLSRHGELTAMFQPTGGGAADAGTGTDLVLESPSGKRTRLSATGPAHLAELHEQGFYELRGSSTAVGSGRPVAVNVDPAESDLSRFDPAELVAALTAANGTTESAGSANSVLPQDFERRQTIWWYLLFGVLLVMAAETVLSNRLSRATS